MEKNPIVQKLLEWEKTHKKLNEAYEPLSKYFGVENPLDEALWTVFEKYTNTISELIGDEHEWLPWYQYETDMGKRSKEVQFQGKKFRIKSIQSLVNIIIKTK